MPSQKLSALVNLAGGQVPTDLMYIVDVSAGAAGSKRSTLNDFLSTITKNITDGAVRFQAFTPPAVSAAAQGSIYFDSVLNQFLISENAGAYTPLGDVRGPAGATDEALARFDGATGKLLQDSLITLSNAGALTFPDNVRQVFNPGATVAGLNVGALAGDPGTPINGDLWYDSTGNNLRARINGASVSLGQSVPGGANTQVQYNNAGAFGGVTGATSNGTAITFTAANLIATSPLFITSIRDANNAVLWTLTATTTAVNFLNYANAAAGNSPMWTAGGTDASVGFWITPKGSGEFRLYDPANATNLFAVRQLGISQFPRTLFQGGESASDSNWVMRFADFYSSSGLNINVGIQLSTNNDNNYSNAETLFFLTRVANHTIFSVSGSSNPGAPIQITTDANLGSTPNLYLDTVANGGLVGVGLNVPTSQLHVLCGATGRTGFIVNNPSGSTQPIASFQVNSVPFVVVDSTANSYFGNGITNAAPASYVINATGGSGSNIAGANLDLAGGKGTGLGVPGFVAVRYPLIGATGTTLQSLSTDRFPVSTSLWTPTVDATAVTNTTTETSMFTGATASLGSTLTIQAGSVRVGTLFRLRIYCAFNTTGTPTIRFRLKLGGVTIADSTAITSPNNAGGVAFLDLFIPVTAIGAAGSVKGQMDGKLASSTGGAYTPVVFTGAIGAIAIDFTADQLIDLTAQWSAASSSNVVQLLVGSFIDRIR
jgi:hypothetical protein